MQIRSSILSAKFKFEPKEIWCNVSQSARVSVVWNALFFILSWPESAQSSQYNCFNLLVSFLVGLYLSITCT